MQTDDTLDKWSNQFGTQTPTVKKTKKKEADFLGLKSRGGRQAIIYRTAAATKTFKFFRDTGELGFASALDTVQQELEIQRKQLFEEFARNNYEHCLTNEPPHPSEYATNDACNIPVRNLRFVEGKLEAVKQIRNAKNNGVPPKFQKKINTLLNLWPVPQEKNESKGLTERVSMYPDGVEEYYYFTFIVPFIENGIGKYKSMARDERNKVFNPKMMDDLIYQSEFSFDFFADEFRYVLGYENIRIKRFKYHRWMNKFAFYEGFAEIFSDFKIVFDSYYNDDSMDIEE